jgi:hypothetical protein
MLEWVGLQLQYKCSRLSYVVKKRKNGFGFLSATETIKSELISYLSGRDEEGVAILFYEVSHRHYHSVSFYRNSDAERCYFYDPVNGIYLCNGAWSEIYKKQEAISTAI